MMQLDCGAIRQLVLSLPCVHAGPLQPLQARSSPCARVQFGGEKTDTYFGGYEEDLKSGPGIYCFSTGALYVGQYKVR